MRRYFDSPSLSSVHFILDRLALLVVAERLERYWRREEVRMLMVSLSKPASSPKAVPRQSNASMQIASILISKPDVYLINLHRLL